MYFGHSSRGLSITAGRGVCVAVRTAPVAVTRKHREDPRSSSYSTWGPSLGHVLPKLRTGFCPSLPRGRNTLRHTQRCALTTTQVFLKLLQLTRVNLTVTNRPVTPGRVVTPDKG